MSLTPLGQRLATVAASPEEPWEILAENVPAWPDPPSLQAVGWELDAQYAPSRGTDELLEALRLRQREQGVDVGAESLLVTNGAFDGLGLIARHLSGNAVGRAMCTGPVLLSVADLLRSVGLDMEVLDWPALVGERSWTALGPGDLLYVNSPHNPTGVCLDEATARDLITARRRLGFTLVLDLAYDSFVQDPAACAAPLALVEDWQGVYGLNSFSKNYGAPGLRVGWITAAPEEVARLTARMEWERIAVSTRAQNQAAQLCKLGNQSLTERVRTGHRLVLDWARAHDMRVCAPQGGTHVWVDPGVPDVETLADVLMAEHRLVVTTGAHYYPADSRHIRVPTGVNPAVLTRSLETIAAAAERLRRTAAAG
ncbi:beta-methylarginine biosynthesis bifunctional aminotransferase [Streptomyces sp. NBC_01167]|uniref:beta-methylarginine biosynthesis bifunctional aminotransferase n=1 Tax=Streptomyces sp. NBC_01167 TaxID=2903756 RepID=UPI003867B1B1|nr:beta-methylarginine biosynthesis bifunctional aminotransferase [Streptomyces sp. NBC_01167]